MVWPRTVLSCTLASLAFAEEDVNSLLQHHTKAKNVADVVEDCSSGRCKPATTTTSPAATTTTSPALSCKGFQCPTDYTARPGMESILGGDKDTCCHTTCADVECPVGYTEKPGMESIVGHGSDRDTCCHTTCEGFSCPSGYSGKPGMESIVGHGSDRDTCCHTTCEGFSCPSGYSGKPGMNSIVGHGHDRDTCCLTTCEGYKCPDGHLVADHMVGHGRDKDTCCTSTCIGHKCGVGYTLVPGHGKLNGNGHGACCHSTCEGFQCPAGSIALNGQSNIVGKGHDAEACCEVTTTTTTTKVYCDTFKCEDGFDAKPGRPFCVNNECNRGRCCSPSKTCETFDCGAGFDDKIKDDGSRPFCVKGKCNQARCCTVQTTKATTTTKAATTTATTTPPFFIPGSPKGFCLAWGDPHYKTFDRAGADMHAFGYGDYWIIKNDNLKVQGRYWNGVRNDGKAFIYALTISGKLVDNRILKIEGKHHGGKALTVNGKEQHFRAGKLDTSVFSATYGTGRPVRFDVSGNMLDNIAAIFSRGPKPDTMTINFKKANVQFVINRAMDNGFIDFRVDLGGRLPGGQSGHCGNFNGNGNDEKSLSFNNGNWFNPGQKVGQGEELFHTFNLNGKRGKYCAGPTKFKILKAEGDFMQVCAYKCAGNKYFITENAGFFDGMLSGGQHKGHCSCTNTLRPGCGGNAHEYAYNTPPSHKVCPDDLKSKFITECGKTWSPHTNRPEFDDCVTDKCEVEMVQAHIHR